MYLQDLLFIILIITYPATTPLLASVLDWWWKVFDAQSNPWKRKEKESSVNRQTNLSLVAVNLSFSFRTPSTEKKRRGLMVD